MKSEGLQRYPLAWPVAVPRTKRPTASKFRTDSGRLSVAEAVRRLDRVLRMLGATKVVISSNVPLRLDGTPRSGMPEPEDTGVAVYFSRFATGSGSRDYCFPCDRWDKAADNIAAIAAHLEALRGQERWGVGTIDQAFAGYLALPAGGPPTWREVLGDCKTLDAVNASARKLISELHPDKGVDASEIMRVVAAREAARCEFYRGEKK